MVQVSISSLLMKDFNRGHLEYICATFSCWLGLFSSFGMWECQALFPGPSASDPGHPMSIWLFRLRLNKEVLSCGEIALVKKSILLKRLLIIITCWSFLSSFTGFLDLPGLTLKWPFPNSHIHITQILTAWNHFKPLSTYKSIYLSNWFRKVSPKPVKRNLNLVFRLQFSEENLESVTLWVWWGKTRPLCLLSSELPCQEPGYSSLSKRTVA